MEVGAIANETVQIYVYCRVVGEVQMMERASPSQPCKPQLENVQAFFVRVFSSLEFWHI
jgi:hypothetical protein